MVKDQSNKTFKEWKNEPRHRGLPKKELDQRWKQHLDSIRNNSVTVHPSRNPSNSSTAVRKKAKRNVKKDHKDGVFTEVLSQELCRYFLANLNPWSKASGKARIPDGTGGLVPSSTFQHYEMKTMAAVDPSALSQYQAFFMLRGDMNRYYAINQFDATTFKPNFGTPNTDPMTGVASMKQLYHTCRIVSQGLRVRYDGPPATASGVIVCGILPPSAYLYSHSFDDLALLPYSKVFPAIDGCEINSIPFGNTDGWRRTKMTPNPIDGLATFNWDGGASNPGPANVEYTEFILAKYFGTPINAGVQQQLNDTLRLNDQGILFFAGKDLAADASFVVECVTNFECQLAEKANSPGGELFLENTFSQVEGSSDGVDKVQGILAAAGDEGLNVSSSKKGVSGPGLVDSFAKGAKTFSNIASAASGVFDFLDASAIASTALEWSAPATIEMGLGALALL